MYYLSIICRIHLNQLPNETTQLYPCWQLLLQWVKKSLLRCNVIWWMIL